MRNCNSIVVHHTAGPKNSTVAQIRRSHLARGFNDIGYHMVIYGNGTSHRGRPEEIMGAHAKGANRGSLGVSVCGNFENEQPERSQLWRLIFVLTYWCDKYGISPNNISGHRDVGTTATACPGRNLYRYLPTIRHIVARQVRHVQDSNIILGHA